ncbi:MAG: immunity protein 12 [Tannerella sp.]|jgi:hypothetical protein|nr:immunity protein 12 [Tannerella sp.]
MVFIISTAIGGQVTNVPNINIRNINFSITNCLKNKFEQIEFIGLDKLKINLYISGDLSEYCNCTGIKNIKYIMNKKEISAEFCIQKIYWETLPELSTEEKFAKYMYSSLLDLSNLIKKRLNKDGYLFDKEFFDRIVKESIGQLLSQADL